MIGCAEMKVYEKYGIDPLWVKRAKEKIKNKTTKERVREIFHDITAEDLQNKAIVSRLLSHVSKALGEQMTDAQCSALLNFVISQNIDPANPLHKIRLWNMFR
jgi:predicted transcriptional regulator